MNERLPEGLIGIENSRVIVCEGSGDACLVHKLMDARGIQSCSIGYPNEKDAKSGGKDAIGLYIRNIKNWFFLHPEKALDRLAIVLDSDENPQAAFRLACKALEEAGIPAPNRAFSREHLEHLAVAVYLIPGLDEEGTPLKGTLEDLLLLAAFNNNPHYQGCLSTFIDCIGKAPTDKPNKLAKMRLSSLVGASFEPNPWAAVDKLLASRKSSNLIPLDSHHFDHLADFLAEFCKG